MAYEEQFFRSYATKLQVTNNPGEMFSLVSLSCFTDKLTPCWKECLFDKKYILQLIDK